MKTPLRAPDSSAAFVPFRLFLGIAALVTIMLGLILLQGFFIALAKLDRRQTMLLLYPLYIYALPAYYCASKWVGRTLPNQAFLVAIMQTISSFLLVSLINLIWLELPFVHTLTDAYILISYLAVSILGAAQGKKSRGRPLCLPESGRTETSAPTTCLEGKPWRGKKKNP